MIKPIFYKPDHVRGSTYEGASWGDVRSACQGSGDWNRWPERMRAFFQGKEALPPSEVEYVFRSWLTQPFEMDGDRLPSPPFFHLSVLGRPPYPHDTALISLERREMKLCPWEDCGFGFQLENGAALMTEWSAFSAVLRGLLLANPAAWTLEPEAAREVAEALRGVETSWMTRDADPRAREGVLGPVFRLWATSSQGHFWKNHLHRLSRNVSNFRHVLNFVDELLIYRAGAEPRGLVRDPSHPQLLKEYWQEKSRVQWEFLKLWGFHPDDVVDLAHERWSLK
jgi:hypothetical protein